MSSENQTANITKKELCGVWEKVRINMDQGFKNEFEFDGVRRKIRADVLIVIRNMAVKDQPVAKRLGFPLVPLRQGY